MSVTVCMPILYVLKYTYVLFQNVEVIGTRKTRSSAVKEFRTKDRRSPDVVATIRITVARMFANPELYTQCFLERNKGI